MTSLHLIAYDGCRLDRQIFPSEVPQVLGNLQTSKLKVKSYMNISRNMSIQMVSSDHILIELHIERFEQKKIFFFINVMI